MRWLLILLFILPVSYAADIDIYVERDGTVEINSDHPELLSGDQWTSKKGSYWVLNISTKETLQDYHFTAHLPPSKVNYIKTSKVITIEDDHGVVIEGKGEQKPFVLVVQYTLKPEPSTIWLPVGIVLGGFILGIYYFLSRKKSPKPILSERQEQIYRLIKHKPVTQAYIERETGLPKASLSRNIDSLIGKGLIAKERKGMSNVLYRTEKVPERSGFFR